LEKNPNKFLFDLRLLLWLFLPFSLIAAWGTRMIHGVEYFFLFGKVAKNRFSLFAWMIAFMAVMFTVAAYVTRKFAIDDGLPLEGKSSWVLLLSAFSFGLTLMHYYLGREIFRMRTPASREAIAPLLKR
jgi:hypothetical protein